MSNLRSFIIIAALLLLLGLTIWITPQIGSVDLEEADLEQVIKSIRIPALQLGMLAGAGLALAGMTFQAIFRNPLATPFTLGVSSGASLAIAIGLACGMTHTVLGAVGQSTLAFVGAIMVVFVVYAIAQMRSESSTSTLLLAGVCINFICGAGIILIQYLIQEHESKQIIHWLIGSVEAIGRADAILTVSIMMAIGIVLLVYIHRDLDLLMMGEQIAASRGVEVKQARWLAYFCASMMTAAVVSVCGPIAFVGLLVPHTMRTLIGPNHRLLLPACLLFGMSLLPICDCIARNFLAWTTENNYTQLPVGVVTNVLGGIFFLIILIRQRSDRPILA